MRDTNLQCDLVFVSLPRRSQPQDSSYVVFKTLAVSSKLFPNTVHARSCLNAGPMISKDIVPPDLGLGDERSEYSISDNTGRFMPTGKEVSGVQYKLSTRMSPCKRLCIVKTRIEAMKLRPRARTTISDSSGEVLQVRCIPDQEPHVELRQPAISLVALCKPF